MYVHKPAGRYMEWRVTGKISGEEFDFTWSTLRNPHLGDPEVAARAFVAQAGFKWTEGPYIRNRLVRICGWHMAPAKIPPRRIKLSETGLEVLCGKCERPRGEHGGPQKLGKCPGGLGRRFSVSCGAIKEN